MSRHPAALARRFNRGLMTGPVGTAVLLVVAWVLTCGVSSAHADHAQPPASREYRIKAAFLFNFIKFIEWPAEAFPDPSSPITLAVLGEDPFGAALDSIDGKTLKGRRLVVKRYARVRDLNFPHVLFISSSENMHLPQIVEILNNSTVLTVGEEGQFTHLGGIINFVIRKNKIRFEINMDAAERAGLTISSKLLRLATVVRTEHRGRH